MRTKTIRAWLGVCGIAMMAPAAAQTAELPGPDQFVVGEKWEWRRVDARTKVEIGTTVRTVGEKDGTRYFANSNYEDLPISGPFLRDHHKQNKPWRVWPLVVGAAWEVDEDWVRPDGVSGNTKQDVKVVAYEKVSVPAGTFMVFKIEHKGWYRNSRGRSGRQNDIYWYAPAVKADIKQIRNYGRDDWISELVEYAKPE